MSPTRPKGGRVNILEWLVSKYLTRRDIAWRGACGHLRSPDVLFSSECPTCKEGWDE